MVGNARGSKKEAESQQTSCEGKKDKRIRDEAAAETAEAEVAAIAAKAAAEVVTRTAANALAVARPPTAPTPAAGVPDHFVSEPMSMAANLLIQKTTSPLVDPTQPHVLLAVMAALTHVRLRPGSHQTKVP